MAEELITQAGSGARAQMTRMPHSQALELLREKTASTIAECEPVELKRALGRILFDDIRAGGDVPAYDNAAVDGYAFCHGDLAEGAARGLPILSRLAAGDSALNRLKRQSAARIFTGALLPAGADTIAMQEDCQIERIDNISKVRLPADLAKGANCRRAGEDVAAGDFISRRGKRLLAADIAAFASLGLTEISVFRKLRVAILSSGNELIRPGDTTRPGSVFDSNHYMLSGLLAAPFIEVSDFGVALDNIASLSGRLEAAATAHDFIIVTGGASQGEEDHTAELLARLGERFLWQLAVKPGRPMAAGNIGKSLVLALPGNPVAVMTCFMLYGVPSLLHMAGGAFRLPRYFTLPAAFHVKKKKPGRREFYRGWMVSDIQGNITAAEKFTRDGSGLISGLRQAEGLIEIPEDITEIRRGDPVQFLPFSHMQL